MSRPFEPAEDALMALADPSNPAWGGAFQMLASNPATAGLMLETFRETLEQMGVEPSGVDRAAGEPVFELADVARAMGVPEDELDIPVQE